MALTSEREQPWVVGFSGLGVEGVAEMRAPVFERPEGRYFVGDPDAPEPPESECSYEELVALEERGLATLTIPGRRWRRVPGGVVVYAHPAFVKPGPGLFDLAEDPRHLEGLDFDERLRFHVGYFAREAALAKLRVWGEALLHDAKRALWAASPEPAWGRAFDSASRARMMAPRPEHPDLRQEAFVTMGAAWRLLGKDWKDMLWMVRMDRNPALLATVEEGSPSMVQGVRVWRDAAGRRRSMLSVGGVAAPARKAA
jgi:hypothetical protein